MADQTPLDLDALRSRIKQFTEIQSNLHEDASLISSDQEDLVNGCILQLQGKISEIIEDFSDVSGLKDEDYDAYKEHLEEELRCVEAENAKLFDEIGNLTKGILEDYIRLQSNIDGLTCSLELVQSKGYEAKSTDAISEKMDSIDACTDWKFKILELGSEIEMKKGTLKSLEDLDFTFKRFENMLKIEDALTGIEVIEYEGNMIRLSLRTYVPECSEQNHELTIELVGKTLELKDAKIFPDDVYMGEIIDAAKSSRQQFSLLLMTKSKTSLEWFVRRVQERIVLSTMRKSLVKAATNSRHYVEYIEREELIVAHMVGRVDAFIKVPQGWPIANSALKLLYIKGSNQSSMEFTLSFLCKVEEMVNCLDEHVCQNVCRFIDAIGEILKQRMRIELKFDQ